MLNVFLTIYFNKYVSMYKNSLLGVNSKCKDENKLNPISEFLKYTLKYG